VKASGTFRFFITVSNDLKLLFKVISCLAKLPQERNADSKLALANNTSLYLLREYYGSEARYLKTLF
jgi:hypothetical protein